MTATVEKKYDGDYTITIIPDSEHMYIAVESKQAGLFYLVVDKYGMANIVTAQGISEKKFDMKDFQPYPDTLTYIVTETTVRILPSKSKYVAETN
jgi:hypothetical protein